MSVRLRATPVFLAVWLCTSSCERVGAPSSAPTASAPSTTLTVAAAADLTFAFDELTSAFRRQQPDIDLRVTFGSSGNFYAQIVNQAPFEVFLSADREYPRRLVADGLADAGSEFFYAIGRLVVWARTAAADDAMTDLGEFLRQTTAPRIALANPAHAPYGRAAEHTLKHFASYERLRERLVFGDNVAQTAHFAESGAADLAFIARSLAVAPALQSRGRYWDVPAEAHPPLEQTGVILKGTRRPEAAARLRDFILSAEGRTILQRFGFDPPSE
jgi:molybdate transport system substrate-binding protein